MFSVWYSLWPPEGARCTTSPSNRVIQWVRLGQSEGFTVSLGTSVIVHYKKLQVGSGLCDMYYVIPYKYSTSSPPEASQPVEASQPSTTAWHRGGLQSGSPEVLWKLSTSKPTLLSPNPPLCLFSLQWLWPPTASLVTPLCVLQWQRLDLQPSATGWLVKAGLLCAEPPYCCQRPTGYN